MEKTIKSLLMVPFSLLAAASIIGCSTNESSATTPIQESTSTSSEEAASEETLYPNELNSIVDRLLAMEALVPLGEVPIPEDNPMTPEVLELGQILFFDPRLSGNNEVSCATCHDPELGYGDGRALFETINGEDGARNSQTIINSAFYTSFFWDGRAESLEEQALGPIQDPHEMNMPLDELLIKLGNIEGYEELFFAAFNEGITKDNIGKALAAFQRQIVINDTAYDRFLQGDRNALTPQEIRGLDLFAGKAFCITCHGGENLSDNKFYNIGLNSDDEGRFGVTEEADDLGRFRTPSLYGITHTGPYMHDGSIETLEEVIQYYNRGGDDNPNKSIFMHMFMTDINLSEEEQQDLLAFLKTLGGEVPIFSKPVLPGMND